MKAFARVKIVDNKYTLIIPNIVAHAFQLNDGDVLELDVKTERIIAKKIDDVKYLVAKNQAG